MSKSVTRSGIAVVLILLGFFVSKSWQTDVQKADRPVPPPEISRSESPEPSTSVQGQTETIQPTTTAPIKNNDPRLRTLTNGRTMVTESEKIAKTLHTKALPPQSDLEAIDAIFGSYRWAFREIPEGGDNRELTAALTGKNPRNLVFIPENHPGISSDGELLDRWGTPYFFHKISDQIIDVTSAGPDQRLWSRDDLTLGYTESYQASSSTP